jgi:excisionase family DNA binding protein
MGKARAEFPLEDLPAASRRNTDSESTLEAPGRIPSWAAETFDLNGLSDAAPPGPACLRSPRSAGGSAVHPSPSPVSPLMTIAEAATALRVSTKTVRRLLDRGELHRVRVGRLVRIRVEDIEQYIRDRTSI